ncbi:MAG: Rpn family recombination-promoting nuclease/putative transposase, partial [Candidatus Azobacteroides sp.]|nr:Rpn family recombination-promoting nuclease/putative transposase [Candidatus Azobacteroides sp.]
MRKRTSVRFANLLTAWGFKRYFGEEKNKKYLIHFLNEILKGKESIRERGELFYDKLNFVYVELAKFKKPLKELDNEQDFW